MFRTKTPTWEFIFVAASNGLRRSPVGRSAHDVRPGTQSSGDLDGARCRWKLANRRPLHDGELSCPSCSRPRFPSSLRRRALAGPPTVRFSRRAPTC
eukprot:scaffold10988_cov62-Phaeocystis_antarctica.AAC.6